MANNSQEGFTKPFDLIIAWKKQRLPIMQQAWQEVEHKANEAAKDFKVFCHGIKEQANVLRNNYRFFTNNSMDSKFEITSLRALQDIYNQSLARAKQQMVRTEQLAGNNIKSFEQYLKQAKNANETTTRNNNAKLKAWNKIKGQFLELLCLLSTLSKVQSSNTVRHVQGVFNALGPISISEKGIKKNLWTQQTLSDTKSGLNARPDIILTSPDQSVTTQNVLSIIECKCVKQITSTNIRAEFGKAHDLRVNSYTIITYYNVETRIIEAAKSFGLDLIPFRLHTTERDIYVKNPIQLGEALAEDLQKSRHENNFLKLLDTVADEAKRKLPAPS